MTGGGGGLVVSSDFPYAIAVLMLQAKRRGLDSAIEDVAAERSRWELLRRRPALLVGIPGAA
jgi:hypothetical protein